MYLIRQSRLVLRLLTWLSEQFKNRTSHLFGIQMNPVFRHPKKGVFFMIFPRSCRGLALDKDTKKEILSPSLVGSETFSACLHIYKKGWNFFLFALFFSFCYLAILPSLKRWHFLSIVSFFFLYFCFQALLLLCYPYQNGNFLCLFLLSWHVFAGSVIC